MATLLDIKYDWRLRIWRELKFEYTPVVGECIAFDHVDDLAVRLEMYGAKPIGGNDCPSAEDESVYSQEVILWL
jgi:hypothetical protein